MEDDLEKVYVQGYTPLKCYRDFSVAIILILLAIAAPYFAYLEFFIPSSEKASTWLQRSGSITVLLSLIAEYIISRLHGIIRPTGFTSIETEKIRKTIEKPLMFSRYTGGFIAVLGTIIWGYGDLFV